MAEQDGLFASDLYTALERKARQTGDFELIETLRNSEVAKRLAKELGQRVAGFRDYLNNGDVDVVSMLNAVDNRLNNIYDKKGKESVALELQEWEKSIADIDSNAQLDSFFSELECK